MSIITIFYTLENIGEVIRTSSTALRQYRQSSQVMLCSQCDTYTLGQQVAPMNWCTSVMNIDLWMKPVHVSINAVNITFNYIFLYFTGNPMQQGHS